MPDAAVTIPILKRITESLSKSMTVYLNPKEINALFAEAARARDTSPWTITIRTGEYEGFYVDGVTAPSQGLWIPVQMSDEHIVISVGTEAMWLTPWVEK